MDKLKASAMARNGSNEWLDHLAPIFFGNSHNYQVRSTELAYGSTLGHPDEFLVPSSDPNLQAVNISFNACENR